MIFDALGVLVALYAGYAALRGDVYAKSGPWYRIVSRAESPEYFWVVTILYAGLGIALIVLF